METPGANHPKNRRATHRRIPRHSIKLQCRRGASGLGANLAAQFLDVSERGVQLLVTDLLKTGDEIEIVLEGYGFRGAIRRIGEVRWVCPLESGGCRIGVRFNKYINFRELQNLTM
jgi:hypothetical protein